MFAALNRIDVLSGLSALASPFYSPQEACSAHNDYGKTLNCLWIAFLHDFRAPPSNSLSFGGVLVEWLWTVLCAPKAPCLSQTDIVTPVYGTLVLGLIANPGTCHSHCVTH